MTIRRTVPTMDRESLRDLRREMIRGLAIALIPTLLCFGILFLFR